jgi:hypothetical protein
MKIPMNTIKKVAPKKAAQKTTKTTRTKAAKKELVCAEGETCFWTVSGEILADLQELRDLLARISPDVYAYHVSAEKNDFANWVETVLADPELAADLRKAKQPKTAHTVIVRHLKFYSL